MKKARYCIALLMASGLFSNCYAQSHAAIRHGREIAQRLCARCHAIGPEGQSPHRDAPPFRLIVAKGHAENLEEALGEGIVVGHPDMPQFQFNARDVGALIAYLKSLSGKG
jgi:mono/diheme cytochrome c family protein